VAIVGSSGAGKSTLLQILGTLDQPTAGTIRYDNVDVTALPTNTVADFRNQTVGFVFQFHHLLPDFTALENCAMPGLIAGLGKKESQRRAEALLVRMGLSHRLTHRPGELSGGEQQRVALSRALVMQPKILLADEPTGNLDTTTGRGIHDLMLELNRELGMTMLVVTHSEDFAAQMPRQLHMRDGKLVNDGPTLRTSEAHA
jgi:lipoprotein-releasing system ATP-binding protein